MDRRSRFAGAGRISAEAKNTGIETSGANILNCQTHLHRNADPKTLARRWFLKQCGVGLGSIALGQLMGDAGYAGSPTTDPLALKPPHFAPKAKRVIFLFM